MNQRSLGSPHFTVMERPQVSGAEVIKIDLVIWGGQPVSRGVKPRDLIPNHTNLYKSIIFVRYFVSATVFQVRGFLAEFSMLLVFFN
jgi:hypothetical protein